jgi:hypothetical protein
MSLPTIFEEASAHGSSPESGFSSVESASPECPAVAEAKIALGAPIFRIGSQVPSRDIDWNEVFGALISSIDDAFSAASKVQNAVKNVLKLDGTIDDADSDLDLGWFVDLDKIAEEAEKAGLATFEVEDAAQDVAAIAAYVAVAVEDSPVEKMRGRIYQIAVEVDIMAKEARYIATIAAKRSIVAKMYAADSDQAEKADAESLRFYDLPSVIQPSEIKKHYSRIEQISEECRRILQE